jgi:uncharacterized protein (DUF885 family)
MSETAALAADFWEFHLQENPTAALELDAPRPCRALFKDSIADHVRRDQRAEAFLERLRGLPTDGLREQDFISSQLLERQLRDLREHFAFQSHLRPGLYPTGPETRIAFVLGKMTLATPAEADDYLARIESIPAFFAACRERLWAGVEAGYRLPEVLLSRVCRAAESYLAAPIEQSVWLKPMATALGRDAPAFKRARADLETLIAEKVQPAYREWADQLRSRYAKYCRSSIAISDEPAGTDYYDFLVRYQTTTTLDPKQIHAIGRAETARIRSEMEQVASQAGFESSLSEYRAALSADSKFIARSGEELRERMEILAKRIERRIPEFFGRLPRMTYGVESIPEALAAQLPPAYAQPNPSNGRAAGIFWVTSVPKACPSYLHVPFAMHEGWPGHLMHFALIQEMRSLPAFRRHTTGDYSAFVEGWALYCERLGHEFGLLNEPAAHYGRLEMEIWRAVRLVVDTGIHAMGWSREQAIAYMSEHLTLPPTTIAAEVDRYIGWPGQALAYKVGEIKVRELRDRATEALGPGFDLRAFHDRLLDCGLVTLDLLDRHIQSWIDLRRSEAV